MLQLGVDKQTDKHIRKGPNVSAELPEHHPCAPGQSRGTLPATRSSACMGPIWQTSFYPLPANAMELADNGLSGCQNPTCGSQMSQGPANPAGRSVQDKRLPSICFRCCSHQSTAIIGGEGSFGEKSINPALHPGWRYLLWFKLSDWGSFFICCNLSFT